MDDMMTGITWGLVVGVTVVAMIVLTQICFDVRAIRKLLEKD